MSKFVYFNNNPYGLKEEDCVTRAITLANGYCSYEEIKEKLELIAKLFNCEKLCVCCYRHLLDDVFKYQRVNCDDLLVGEFADKYPFGIFLLRINGHITCLIDGTIYDIWDCRNELITDAWRVD